MITLDEVLWFKKAENGPREISTAKWLPGGSLDGCDLGLKPHSVNMPVYRRGW